MSLGPKKLFVYETQAGVSPFLNWMQVLGDRKARAIIRAKLDRLEAGLSGDIKPLG